MKKCKNSLLLFSLYVLTFTSCQEKEQDTLNDLERVVKEEYVDFKISASFCTSPADSIKSKLKFLFVVDRSGSNFQRRVPNDPIPKSGTDEKGDNRFNAILRFIDTIIVDNNDDTVYASMINFSTSSGGSNNTDVALTNDLAFFRKKVCAQKHNNNLPLDPNSLCYSSEGSSFDGGTPSDVGWTNYLSGLENVRDFISQDIQRERTEAAQSNAKIVASNYIVFFVSDGAPWIRDNQNNLIMQSRVDINNALNAILAFNESEQEWVDVVQTHVAYYTSPLSVDDNGIDPEAQDLLKNMALTGHGTYLEFSGTSEIDFSQFEIPVRNIPNTLVDIIAVNMSTVWKGGKLLEDKDSDGISDLEEIELGSDPEKNDSDDNGVSDGAELRLNGTPCASSSCSISQAKMYNNCSDLMLNQDLDGDGLNRCVENIFGTSDEAFDSNYDWLPDDLSLRYDLAAKLLDPSETSADLDLDIMTNFNEIKYNTPIDFNNNRIIDLKKIKYNLKTTSTDLAGTCYDLEVKDMSIVGTNNLIRLYLMESSKFITNRRILRVAQRYVDGSDNLIFSASDFKTAGGE